MFSATQFFKTVFIMIVVVQPDFMIGQDSNDIHINSNNLVGEDSPHGEFTARDVIDDYLEAIGGRESFVEIIDRTTILQGEMGGQNVRTIIKQKSSNFLHQEVRLGELIQTLIFNGDRGIIITGNQQSEITGYELNRLKLDAAMDFLLDPEAYGVTINLAGNEIVDSMKCNIIEITTAAGKKWKQFYDINTRLKIKEVKEVETPQGVLLQETYFKDYMEVDGLKFPSGFSQSLGMQSIDWTVTSIELNTGMEDSIFIIPE